MTQYRILSPGEISRELFGGFRRRQVVTKCWRRENGVWVVRDIAFIDDWTEEDYCELVAALRDTAARGGLVMGAFCGGALKGFVSAEPELTGGAQRYIDMTNLHVSEDMRGRGLGRALFLAAKSWAGQRGARKLYLSAHSAVESQAFYRAMGCTEAQVYDPKHVAAEPYDCQLECEV